MQKFILTLLILSSFIIPARAQSIKIGDSVSIYSCTLEDERTVLISLPASYHNDSLQKTNYPIVYLLDGEAHFEYMQAFIKRLSTGMYPQIPEMIVVGILQKDRAFELTPSSPTPKETDNNAHLNNNKNGGASKFLTYLQKDVKSYIKEHYRTADYDILIGHSFGGLFAINTFIHAPESFNAYVAHDPSIWWDDCLILKQLQATTTLANQPLFISQVDSNNNTGDLAAHYKGIQDVKNYFLSKKQPLFKYKQYPNEDHGTVVIPANYDAIRWMFEGFEFNVKSLKVNPKGLEAHFNEYNNTHNTQLKPSETYFNNVLSYLKKIKAEDAYKVIQDYKSKSYPK